MNTEKLVYICLLVIVMLDVASYNGLRIYEKLSECQQDNSRKESAE